MNKISLSLFLIDTYNWLLLTILSTPAVGDRHDVTIANTPDRKSSNYNLRHR